MQKAPSDRRYTEDHEWAKAEGDVVRVGISEYAVNQLGDVTLVDLPAVGAQVKAKERFGDIESVKTVSELFAPVSGVVAEVNGQLAQNPENVNSSPYADGWMIAIRTSGSQELNALMDSAAYDDYIGKLDH